LHETQRRPPGGLFSSPECITPIRRKPVVLTFLGRAADEGGGPGCRMQRTQFGRGLRAQARRPSGSRIGQREKTRSVSLYRFSNVYCGRKGKGR
jgi:hypothetical protein